MASPSFWEARGRLLSVDVMRGLAALGVLLVHIPHQGEPGVANLRFWLLLPLEYGRLGVPIFVVLSGFCIHLGVAKKIAQGDRGGANWRSFWWRRFHRLYPPYLAAIILGVLAYQASSASVIGSFQRITTLPEDVAVHLAMVANLFTSFWSGVGNFPLWTLSMEEQLYALYALYLVIRMRTTTGLALALALAVSVAWTIGAVAWFPESLGSGTWSVGEWPKWPFAFWFNWVLGAVAAEAFAGSCRLPRWGASGRVAVALFAIGLATSGEILGRLSGSHWLATRTPWAPLPMVLEWITLLASPVAIALAVFVALNYGIRVESSGTLRGKPILHALGTVGLFSYSLYLTHIPILNLLSTALPLDDSSASVALRYFIFTPTCLGFAYLFYRAIEVRCLNASAARGAAPASSLGS